MSRKTFNFAFNLLAIAASAAVCAYSITALLSPYGIVPGGVTGIAMILRFVFPALPLGLTVLTINIPLFIASWRMLGHKFLLYTAFGTLMSGEGFYGGASKKVILTAVKRQQTAILKSIVRELDPDAFVILSEAAEVLGEGFKFIS